MRAAGSPNISLQLQFFRPEFEANRQLQGVLHYLPQGMFADTTDNAISMVEPMERCMMFDQYDLPSHLTEVELINDLVPYTLTHPHRPYAHLNSCVLWGMKHQQVRRQNSHFSHMKKMYGVEDPLSDYWDAMEATLTSQGDKRITGCMHMVSMVIYCLVKDCVHSIGRTW